MLEMLLSLPVPRTGTKRVRLGASPRWECAPSIQSPPQLRRDAAQRRTHASPCRVLAVPFHGRRKAILETQFRDPAQIAFRLRPVDGIATVVAGPILHEPDEGAWLVQQIKERVNQFQIGAFGGAAEVV